MIRVIALLASLVLVGLFALLNWNAFATPTPLSLGITTVEAPLGLIMLGAVVFLSLLFTVWAMSLQAAALLESRRHTKELHAQRELADKAEASRFTELRSVLMAELARLMQAQLETREAVANRMDEGTRTVEAYLGQLEDRMENSRVLEQRRDEDELVSR